MCDTETSKQYFDIRDMADCSSETSKPCGVQVEQFTNALQRQSIAREEEGGEEEGGLPEAAEDLADEMAVAALSRTISMREDPPSGLATSQPPLLHILQML